MKKWMKILLIVVGGLFSLLLIAAIGVRMWLPGFIRGMIEETGTESLQTQVTVEDVDLALFFGTITIKGLSVASPEGFGDDPIFSTDAIHADVSLSSLGTELIVVEEVRLDRLTMNAKRNADGFSNLKTLQEKITPEEASEESEGEGEEEEAPAEEAGPANSILIEAIALNDITLNFRDETHNAGAGVSGTLSFQDLAVPAEGSQLELNEAVIQLANLALSLDSSEPLAAENPNWMTLESAQLRFDQAEYYASQDDPRIIIPLFEAKSATFRQVNAGDFNNTELWTRVVRGALGVEEPPEIEEETLSLLEQAQSLSEIILSASEEDYEAPPPQPDPEGLDFLLLQELRIGPLDFELIRPEEEGGGLAFYNIELNGKDWRYPSADERPELQLAASPLEAESRIELTMAGDFLQQHDIRDLDLSLRAANQKLREFGPLEEARTDANFNLVMKDSKGEGSLDFMLRDFRLMADANMVSKAIFLPFLNMEETPKYEAPYEIELTRNTWPELASSVGMALSKSLTKNIDVKELARQRMDEAKDQVKEKVGELTDQIPGGDRAKEKVDEAAEKAAEQLKGLF